MTSRQILRKAFHITKRASWGDWRTQGFTIANPYIAGSFGALALAPLGVLLTEGEDKRTILRNTFMMALAGATAGVSLSKLITPWML